VTLPESKFKSSESCVAWQRNVSSSHGNAGREIILKTGTHFDHFLWGTTFELLKPNDTDLDTYSLSNVNTVDYMRVKLVSRAGFMILAEYYTADPMQVVSQTVVEDHQIKLYGLGLMTDRWLLNRLRGLRASNFITTTMFDYYQAAENIVVETVAPEQEGEEVMADLGGELEFDMGDLLSGLSDIEYASDADDSSSSSSNSSGGEESAPVSTQSSIRQPQGVLINLAHSGVRALPTKMVENAARACKKSLGFGISLTLPVKIPTTRLVDNDISAIQQLYSIISELDELDRIWLTEYLDLSLLSYGPIKLILEHTVEEDSESSEVDDSW